MALLVQIFYLIQPILSSFPSAQYMCGLEKPVRAFVGAQAESNRSERSSPLKNIFAKEECYLGGLKCK